MFHVTEACGRGVWGRGLGQARAGTSSQAWRTGNRGERAEGAEGGKGLGELGSL